MASFILNKRHTDMFHSPTTKCTRSKTIRVILHIIPKENAKIKNPLEIKYQIFLVYFSFPNPHYIYISTNIIINSQSH